jgi:2-polyprenyl-3-methyl-5-hydroxy-6-metoxy-1,4-benzoquinol methylase
LDIDVPWIGADDRVSILVIRSPFNWLASLKSHGTGMFRVTGSLKLLRIWCKYAEAAICRDDCIVIYYDKFIESKKYRNYIADKIGVDSRSDGALSRVCRIGRGSSFDSIDFDGNASEMDTKARWKNYEHEEWMIDAMKDERVLELLSIIENMADNGRGSIKDKVKRKRKLEAHLGGHLWTTHIDDGALSLLKEELGITTLLDVGCGTGGMVEHAESMGITAEGIDGDYTVKFPEAVVDKIKLHDYTTGVSHLKKTYDLIWSVEFLEHVEEQFMDNYMADFKKGKYVMITFNRGLKRAGHHHVNCQLEPYWVDAFERRGFIVDWEMTARVREASTMKREFVRDTGLVFKNSLEIMTDGK